jgi:hypothetical protein
LKSPQKAPNPLAVSRIFCIIVFAGHNSAPGHKYSARVDPATPQAPGRPSPAAAATAAKMAALFAYWPEARQRRALILQKKNVKIWRAAGDKILTFCVPDLALSGVPAVPVDPRGLCLCSASFLVSIFGFFGPAYLVLFDSFGVSSASEVALFGAMLPPFFCELVRSTAVKSMQLVSASRDCLAACNTHILNICVCRFRTLRCPGCTSRPTRIMFMFRILFGVNFRLFWAGISCSFWQFCCFVGSKVALFAAMLPPFFCVLARNTAVRSVSLVD